MGATTAQHIHVQVSLQYIIILMVVKNACTAVHTYSCTYVQYGVCSIYHHGFHLSIQTYLVVSNKASLSTRWLTASLGHHL